jgi:hypothetical protein
MAIILRDDIAKTLFRFGKRVEKEIRNGNKLDILELNNLLRPTLETIESKAVSFATKEVEETITERHSNKRKRKREKLCDRRRATLSEKAVLETPMKRIRIERRIASNISELEDSTSYDPESDLDCLNDSEVLEYDTEDESWDKYLPQVLIDGEEEYILCGGDLKDLMEYLEEHANTVEEMLAILESVQEKDILTYGYFLTGMIRLCNLLIKKSSPVTEQTEIATWEEDLNVNSEDTVSSLDLEEILDEWDEEDTVETTGSSEEL